VTPSLAREFGQGRHEPELAGHCPELQEVFRACFVCSPFKARDDEHSGQSYASELHLQPLKPRPLPALLPPYELPDDQTAYRTLYLTVRVRTA